MEHTWANGARLCSKGNTKSAACGLTNKGIVAQISATLIVYQAVGAAFSPTYKWNRQGSAVSWVPSMASFALMPYENMLKEHYFEFAFWIAVAFSTLAMSTLVFLMAFTGKESSMMLDFVDLMLNTFYLSILAALLSPWSCSFSDNHAVTHAPFVTSDGSDTPMPCYQGDLMWTTMAVVSAVITPFFILIALVSVILFKVHDESDALNTGVDFKFLNAIADFACRTALACIITFTGHTENKELRVSALVAMLVLFVLLTMVEIKRSCNLDSVNLLNFGGQVLCTWSCMMALVTCPYPGDEIVTWLWLIVSVLWVVFVGVNFYLDGGIMVTYLGWENVHRLPEQIPE